MPLPIPIITATLTGGFIVSASNMPSEDTGDNIKKLQRQSYSDQSFHTEHTYDIFNNVWSGSQTLPGNLIFVGGGGYNGDTGEPYAQQFRWANEAETEFGPVLDAPNLPLTSKVVLGVAGQTVKIDSISVENGAVGENGSMPDGYWSMPFETVPFPAIDSPEGWAWSFDEGALEFTCTVPLEWSELGGSLVRWYQTHATNPNLHYRYTAFFDIVCMEVKVTRTPN